MKIRITGWWWFGFIPIALLGVTLWKLRRAADEIRTVTFADGTTVRLVGVTYGTTHVSASTPLGRVVSRLPAVLRNRLPSALASSLGLSVRYSYQPTLMVWIDHWGPPGLKPSFPRALLRPADGHFSGSLNRLSLINQPGNAITIHGISLDAFPSTARDLELVFFEENGARYDLRGALPFRNPRPLPTTNSGWTSFSLPQTATADDLKVTLLAFASGLGQYAYDEPGGIKRVPAQPGEEPQSLVQVAFESPSGTNETWSLFNADLTDGFGRTLNANLRSDMSSQMLFSPILWDEGVPWKLRLHLLHTAGFSNAELISWSNVPLPRVGQFKRINLTNRTAGVTAVLRHFNRRPNLTNFPYHSSEVSELKVEHPDLGTNRQFGTVRIVAQPSGTNLAAQASFMANYDDQEHSYRIYSFPEGTTHLDLTFSLQPMRYVEFTVNPNWVTNEMVVPR